MRKDPYSVILGPVITEKTTVLKEKTGALCFKVADHATKIDIKQAVKSLFDREVADVRIVNTQGKLKRLGRNFGRRAHRRKAYVALKPGQKPLEYFDIFA